MSRYSAYSEFITETAREAGESGSALDTLILNILKSVVDGINTIRCPMREATTSFSVSSSDYDYPLSVIASDFNEILNHRRGLYYRSGGVSIFIPVRKSRVQFVNSWNPAILGTVHEANIFGGVLYLKDTPSSGFTAYLDYYKNLATPTTDGEVLIPDQYLSLIRMEILNRLEAYNESGNAPVKGAFYSGVRNAVLMALHRDYSQNSLPTEIEVDDDEF